MQLPSTSTALTLLLDVVVFVFVMHERISAVCDEVITHIQLYTSLTRIASHHDAPMKRGSLRSNLNYNIIVAAGCKSAHMSLIRR